MSNNIIHCIFQDSYGWIWFGTSQGLNRFDGYKFTVFRNDPDDSTSLASDLVRAIYEDSNRDLWIGTENGGLHKFSRDKENFTRFVHQRPGVSLSNNSVNTITEDKFGNLWVGTESGLNKINLKTGAIQVYLHQKGNSNSLCDNLIRVLHPDAKGGLCIGTNNGLDILNLATGRFEHVKLPEANMADDEIWEIFEDHDGKLWIGTYTGGVVIYDPVKKSCETLNFNSENKRSQTVRAILRDINGLYWIGTRGGLFVYDKGGKQVLNYQHDERVATGLCHNSVLDIFQDAKGDVWVGTRGGVSYLIREKQVFEYYRALPDDDRFLNNSEVYAFWIDPQDNIWIATENGGINILDRKTNKFRYMTKGNSKPNGLSNNCIKTFLDDKEGNLWIGTYMGGINVYNFASRKFKYFDHNVNDPNSLNDNRVWAIFRHSQGKIWVGTEVGLDCYEQGKFTHHQNDITNKPVNWIAEDLDQDLWVGSREEVIVYSIKTNTVKRYKERTRGFCLDSRKRIWLATLGKGLALYDKNKGAIKYYNENCGLPNNLTFSVIEDAQGDIWVSTAKGLSKFDPNTGTFKNFGKEDGLQSNQFNYGAVYRSASGDLLFGGINGFNIFNPKYVSDNPYVPPVVFTDFRIFNQTVPIGANRKSFLPKSISQISQLVLPYNQNVLTFEFAALNYARSNKNNYAFILDGFEKKWNNTGNLRSVTYTNLNPGEYVLRVKASNNDNKWNNNGISLKIQILPPWWKTWWFKTLVFVSLLVAIYFLVALFTARVKLKHDLIFERERAQKLHELDMMKLRFFTNISHEIRTPLTLIIGPIEKMMGGSVTAEMAKNYLSVMHRNANQLLRLINQLLDFRKLESGNLKLEPSKGDLVGFVRGVTLSFSEHAEDKGVKLKFNAVKSEIFTWFDPDKVEKIFNNLLSNAIKFTEKGGQVSVSLSLVLDSVDELPDQASNENKFVEIVVRDTGIGIHETYLEKIFLRFFQAPNAKESAGTGIGLALTKELVKLHKGQIFVESKPGKGTKFTVRFPYDTETATLKPGAEQGVYAVYPEKSMVEATAIPPINVSSPSKIMLVIEDNQDVRFFIRTHFQADFQIEEARDGKEGWQFALNVIPDIIISDIMMPGIDGNELCRRLKKDERTSHIPVILLTALSSREHKLSGLDAGADDYMTKPFDIALLKAKIENLLVLRKSLKDKYTGELILKPKNITIASPDERFLQKAIESVEKHISDPDFSIEQFASDLGVSRMQLYRKMEALTDMTVKEFIRNIRLKRAAQLLVQNKMNVSEIAFNIGFNDLSHFRKCFRQEFGMSATEYAEKFSV